MYRCVCIEVWPSDTINVEPISTVVTSSDALYYAIHQPLPAFKTIWSSWSFVVVCPLIAPGITGIASWYESGLAVPGTRYKAVYTRAQQHICTRILGIYTVAEHHLFATYWHHV